jgi:hypothetical protein
MNRSDRVGGAFFESVTPSSLPPSSSSRAGCLSPATRPVRARRCAPAASSAGQPLAQGVRAAPRRGHQRAGWQQGGMGWADAGGGKGRLIFLSPKERIYHAACFEAICARWIRMYRIHRLKTPKFTGTVRYRPSRTVLLPERFVA